MSDSPWNVAPVEGQNVPKPAAPASKPKKQPKEEHVVWNAAPKPEAKTAEKVKDKARNTVEDVKDKVAAVTSNVEGYAKDSVLKVQQKKDEFEAKRKEAKKDKKEAKKEKKEADAGACGLCGIGCSVM